MAAFNWFERSFEEPKEDPKDGDAKAEGEKDESEKAAPASSEDYLNWAKAAYQNIQAREADTTDKGSNPEKDTTSESDVSETNAAVAPSETSKPSETTTEKETDTATGTTAAETTEQSTATAEPEAAADDTNISRDQTEIDQTEPTESTGETTAAAQAFWAKAEQAKTEREERLQRLEAEAIVEPEPEPEPAPAEQKFIPLDIDLDEAFLWSAEVLASQGRRPDEISLEEITWLNKLRQGLDKTRRGLVNQLKAIVGQGPLNDEAVDEIESLLLQADVGVAATDKIISALQSKLREETLPPEQAIGYLKKLLRDMLEAPLEGKHNLTFTPEKEKLSIWLMTGVNGAGKTTTIGKLAHIATKSDFKCLIGAADTFRAAAVEQVKVWGQRSGVDVIANPGQNTDPASVVFDAISAANSRDIELLLIDTAGRLQNKRNLMDELSKVRKIIDKKAPDAAVESLLVLDATLGQNGLRQAQVFAEAAQLSGVVLTKLDGTARGGVALAVVEQLGLPIRFIGAGEGIEDLRPFSSYEFIEALLSG
ncbi:MAG: signal recognition particle-docking protein FtsY [Cyanobacteria bacterium J06621_11]